ncbi:MAG: hypothetical protein ACI4WG_06960, partial [Erysipelotrichaceae bacterium]
VVGLIVAYVCYWAISDWYSQLIGLGVFAAFLLASFVLWWVGRFKFLSVCNYSEADKLHLIKHTKIILFTAVIATFAYLPPVIFIGLEQIINLKLTTVLSLSNKLSFLSFLLCLATFVPTGITIAKILSSIHDKYTGKEIPRLKLIDMICVAFIAITLTVTGFSFLLYIYSEHTVLLIIFALSAIILTVNAIIHKKYEHTSTAIFVLQISCTFLLLANIICFYFTFYYFDNINISIRSIFKYLNYTFGALLTVCAIVLIVLSALQAKRKNCATANQLKIFIPICIFALIQIQPLIGDSAGLFIWLILQCPVFVLPNIIKNK